MKLSRERFVQHLERMAERTGSVLNPDDEDRNMLIDGLLENRERHGYPCCPCRLACGAMKDDKDIVCPCDYQPLDLKEYGSCYCALFVTREWADGTIERKVVPERRPPEKAEFEIEEE